MSDEFDAIFDAEPTLVSSEVEAHDEVEDTTQEVVDEAEPEASPLVEDEPQQADTLQADEQAEDERQAKDHKSVPLPTFLDMRDKMKEERLAREAAERRLAELQQPASTLVIPDPYMDPEGFQALLEDRINQAVFQERITSSHAAALKAHDEKTVSEAVEWATELANSDPSFDKAVQKQPDPVAWVIQQHKAATELSEFQRDPDAFVRRRAEQMGLMQPAAQAIEPAPAHQHQTEKALPKSITNVPPANTTAATKVFNDKDDFNSIFG